jgi:hypothetical protein
MLLYTHKVYLKTHHNFSKSTYGKCSSLSSHPTWFLTLSNFSFPAAYDHPPYSGMCLLQGRYGGAGRDTRPRASAGCRAGAGGRRTAVCLLGLKPKRPSTSLMLKRPDLRARCNQSRYYPGRDLGNSAPTRRGRRLSPLPAIP